MNHASLSKPEAIQLVIVRRHPVDWSDSDFDVVTGQRALAWDRRLSKGCWFLNPRYSVHAPAPSVDFFLKVREVQGSWLRTVRQSIHNRGLRREARRREPLGRQLAFSGILFIDGALIPPVTWQAQADSLLAPDTTSKVSTTHRHLDLSNLKSTGDLGPLKQLAQSALQAHLAEHHNHAAFVLPNLTLSSPTATPTFFQRAEEAKQRWSSLLKRILGNGPARDARHAADSETCALVFRGILYTNGQLYWPDCWPNQVLDPAILERSPTLAPTVPLDFFGLRPCPPNRTPDQSNAGSNLGLKHGPTDYAAINEDFKALFGMTGL